MLRHKNILLAATGSVATIRLQLLLDQLRHRGATVRLLLTATANRFLSQAQPPVSTTDLQVYTDEADWTTWNSLGDPVLHIELRNWAHLLLIAPLSANSLAKIAGGLCDNLLTCVARAWQVGSVPFLVAPAMNTEMWNHPVTDHQIQIIQQWGVRIIPPVEKLLACGQLGVGAMQSAANIVDVVETTFLE